MESTIRISPEIYRLLERRASETRTTPEAVAETALRLQLGNSIHIEQRLTPDGPQAYVRGTRVAVRHIAAFFKAGHSAEEILKKDLPHLSAAGVYEALAYYHDHRAEIEAELDANSEQATRQQLQSLLAPEEYAQLTGKA
jgi:uncharacterized protein (DUF433 family)